MLKMLEDGKEEKDSLGF